MAEMFSWTLSSNFPSMTFWSHISGFIFHVPEVSMILSERRKAIKPPSFYTNASNKISTTKLIWETHLHAPYHVSFDQLLRTVPRTAFHNLGFSSARRRRLGCSRSQLSAWRASQGAATHCVWPFAPQVSPSQPLCSIPSQRPHLLEWTFMNPKTKTRWLQLLNFPGWKRRMSTSIYTRIVWLSRDKAQSRTIRIKRIILFAKEDLENFIEQFLFLRVLRCVHLGLAVSQ